MDHWVENIKRDMPTFSDPGSRIEYNLDGNILTANWSMRRKHRQTQFVLRTDDDIEVREEAEILSYRAFLSGTGMSDLLGVAAMIASAARDASFVKTRARRQDSGGAADAALTLLEEATSSPIEEVTKVIFVTGDAGAGKTEVLREMVRAQAARYLTGEAEFLYLYVNAQGRALARLDEALAAELQDLRASKLTYHVVPALTRNKLLVPVIDGFDELLGVTGYDDAFSSLRRFLDDLNGCGQIVASARSTYYQQEFLSRSGRESSFNSGRVLIDPIEILPWEDDEFYKYIETRYSVTSFPRISRPDFKQRMSEAFSYADNSELRRKPFFVAKIADLILDRRNLSSGNLIDQLVHGFIERERTEKLLDSAGEPLLTSTAIESFVQSICEEMWLTETRVLDTDSIKTLADLAFPKAPNALEADRIVRERAPMMAFFSPAPGRARVEFEHELFFAYFLGRTVTQAVIDGPRALQSILSRSVLPDQCAVFVASLLRNASIEIEKIVNTAAEAGTLQTSRSAQARENAGDIVLEYLRVLKPLRTPQAENISFRNLIFAGDSFRGITLRDCSIADTEFLRVDFSNAALERCKGTHVMFQEITVSEGSSRLEIAGADPQRDFHGLKLRTDSGVVQIFRHDMITTVLQRCGLQVDTQATVPEVDSEILNLLERVLSKFDRSTVICLTDSQNNQITNHPEWPKLERLMIEGGIVNADESIPHKGTPRKALRRNFLPYQVMSGDSGSEMPNNVIVRFWEFLKQEFPAAKSVAMC